jgi:hypothetical protein
MVNKWRKKEIKRVVVFEDPISSTVASFVSKRY